MKKIILIAVFFVIASCKKEQSLKDYAVVYGTISNPVKDANIKLYSPDGDKTLTIKVDEEGNFRDTLKLKNPVDFSAYYNSSFRLYLANNMNLKLLIDASNNTSKVTFSGKGTVENNFNKFKYREAVKLYGSDPKAFLSLEKKDFEAKVKVYEDSIHNKLNAYKSEVPETFISAQNQQLQDFKKQLFSQFEEQQKINTALSKGKPSPEFNNYVNYKGGTSSLKDFRGKYVYIDVWATWCTPCKYEIPFLKEVQAQYKNKNIAFVGISIDTKKDEQLWKETVKLKELGGVQLLADKDYNSQFIKDYFISGIPKFILIDPQGNIVNYDAPRPSEEKLKTLFNSLPI